MGYPIRDRELDEKVRETYARSHSLAGTARECGVGVNRVRRILGKPLPPSQTAKGQAAKRAAAAPPTQPPQSTTRQNMKSITIPLTDTAHERLAAIAETAYLSPEAFAATLIASYLSYQPEKIVLAPSEPGEKDAEDEDAEQDDGSEPEGGDSESGPEEAEEEEAEEEEAPLQQPAPKKPVAKPKQKPEPEAIEPEVDRTKTTDYSFIRPGGYAVLLEGDVESRVWVSQIKAKDGAVKYGVDKVVVKRSNGALVEVMALELSPIED